MKFPNWRFAESAKVALISFEECALVGFGYFRP